MGMTRELRNKGRINGMVEKGGKGEGEGRGGDEKKESTAQFWRAQSKWEK